MLIQQTDSKKKLYDKLLTNFYLLLKTYALSPQFGLNACVIKFKIPINKLFRLNWKVIQKYCLA